MSFSHIPPYFYTKSSLISYKSIFSYYCSTPPWKKRSNRSMSEHKTYLWNYIKNLRNLWFPVYFRSITAPDSTCHIIGRRYWFTELLFCVKVRHAKMGMSFCIVVLNLLRKIIGDFFFHFKKRYCSQFNRKNCSFENGWGEGYTSQVTILWLVNGKRNRWIWRSQIAVPNLYPTQVYFARRNVSDGCLILQQEDIYWDISKITTNAALLLIKM